MTTSNFDQPAANTNEIFLARQIAVLSNFRAIVLSALHQLDHDWQEIIDEYEALTETPVPDNVIPFRPRGGTN